MWQYTPYSITRLEVPPIAKLDFKFIAKVNLSPHNININTPDNYSNYFPTLITISYVKSIKVLIIMTTKAKASNEANNESNVFILENANVLSVNDTVSEITGKRYLFIRLSESVPAMVTDEAGVMVRGMSNVIIIQESALIAQIIEQEADFGVFIANRRSVAKSKGFKAIPTSWWYLYLKNMKFNVEQIEFHAGDEYEKNDETLTANNDGYRTNFIIKELGVKLKTAISKTYDDAFE